MLFNSREFILYFLPVVVMGFYLLVVLRASFAVKYWLIAASFYFYGRSNTWDGALLGALLVINFGFGVLLDRCVKSSRSAIILFLGIAFNLGVLGYFKYAGFLVATVSALDGRPIAFLAPALPLAISFFTFQKIAFLADKARGRIDKFNFFDFVLFVSFFPQLIAGPIVHFREIVPQWRNSVWTTKVIDYAPMAISFFSIGLFKKCVIADTIAGYINPTFSFVGNGGTLDAVRAWQAALGYTGQLYFDFSGYSDMAIGLALIFGIRLPINFFSPYKATSIIDFWRRWHVTLTRFMIEYLYIPLGGNRGSVPRRFLNLMIVMLLGGLWHGAAWTFVAWGALHGFLLVINHAWRETRQYFNIATPAIAAPFLGWAITFLAIVAGWVLFRSASFGSAFSVLAAMVGTHGVVDQVSMAQQAQFVATSPQLLLRDICVSYAWIATALGITLLAPNMPQLTGYREPHEEGARGAPAAAGYEVTQALTPPVMPSPVLYAGAGLALGMALWTVFATRPSEFIYFRF
jgi:alginate O-acetyltransferase complex protein AlgI